MTMLTLLTTMSAESCWWKRIAVCSAQPMAIKTVNENVKIHVSVTIRGTKMYEIKSLLLIRSSFNL